MIGTLLALALVPQDMPKTFDELVKRMNKAYRELTNYTDTWELTDEGSPGEGMRFDRRIDGKKTWLRISTFKPGSNGLAVTPLLEEGANGQTLFLVAFPTKSYYVGKDDGSFRTERNPMKGDKGSLSLGVSNYSQYIECNPAPSLTSIKTIPGQVAGGRVAEAEAVNPDTKNRVTLNLSFLNRWWLLSDLTATIHFANGIEKVIRLHPKTLLMNAKLVAKPFDLDEKLVKNFTKKSEIAIDKDLESISGGG